tara:strand:+ start:3988 stop:4251 length:264 start_codon:yes stop_codon:yes gene_type:complete
MKIYKVLMDMTNVIARLKRFDLGTYNSAAPVIFVEAEDPDGACYKAYHKLNLKLLKKDHSVESIEFVKGIMNDIRIVKVEAANEKKL